ncbi:pyrimidine hmase synthase [Yersinia phage vB_YenM_P744]
MSHWKLMAEELCMTPPTTYASARKIHTNISFEIPWEEFTPILPNIDLRTFGYAGWRAKEQQLDRNYFNEKEFNNANAILIKRKGKNQSCVTARFGGPTAKGEDSMGYCMQSISYNLISKDLRGNPRRVVEVHYRATEFLKKFVADLIYLQERVLPVLLDGVDEPTSIRFHFQTIDINPLYVNIMAQHLDLHKIMSHVMNHERKWSRVFTNGLYQLLTDGTGCQAYATLRKQYESFQEFHKPYLTESEIKGLCELAEIDYDKVKTFSSTGPSKMGDVP